MYLMNVPPVAATHTEWRTCGPHGGYSLPNFFNDSDTELPSRDTPISDKVQMIIESLRSSQSSLEMGDEMEGNSLSGQEGHPQACKVAVGSYVGAKYKDKGPAENQQADVSSPHDKSSDSDSDDSVDRGIEEAILEYLKEKDDHKRKAEACITLLQSSKISRKTSPTPEVSKQNSDSNASSQFPKSVKAETHPTQVVVPVKKCINTVKKLDSDRIAATKGLILSKEQTKSSSKAVGRFNITSCPATVKVEDDSDDSSSDDGIEEAIQRYQLEKKEQQNKREAITPPALEEESDSTSDDGIEEAIRCYQLEQLKEKTVLNPFLHKQQPLSKPLTRTVGNAIADNSKKHKLRKKKSRAEREAKSVQPPPPSVFIPRSTLADGSISKGNGYHLLKGEDCMEQPPPAPPPLPKVNTTAELMCAEAILDISKTVMPGAFHHGVDLGSGAPKESSLQSSLPAEDSDGSSIDSEDGIEQEIRKFLEQKAQMHKQPAGSATSQEPRSGNDPEKMKAKKVAVQKKPQRLSLTQRRKQREENCSIPNVSGTDTIVKGTAHNPLPDGGKEPNPPGFSRRSQIHKTEQSGEKSSSLDSDEDLDTAIKDLLKTKKKSKKKPRDLKRKARKCLKVEERILENASQAKRFKPDPVSKRSALKKAQTGKDDPRDKSGSSETSVSRNKQTDTSEEHDVRATESQGDPLLQKEDSSSVDSDDSIEQEIRRFLAEKAKVSTAEKDGDVSGNGTAELCAPLQAQDIKQENQLAEIPRQSISPPSGQSTLPIPQSLPPAISAVCAQSPPTSVQSASPSVLEPADGAGAARTEQRRPGAGKGAVRDVTPQMERVRPLSSPNVSHSHSESVKWRQSLGLPVAISRTPSRTQFHVTSSKSSDTATATPKFQRAVIAPKSQAPVTSWLSARTSSAPLPCSAQTAVNATFRPPGLNHLLTARQHPRVSFTQSLTPGGRSQCPVEGERESRVLVPKDKSVFVELESNRTNHVQVQSGEERSQGREGVHLDLLGEIKREGESLNIDEKQGYLERTGEEFIDEAECESDNRRNPEKRQGFPTLSLSSAIDPGITFRPCIALTTEERSMQYNRRYAQICTEGLPFLARVPVQNRTVRRVKRKLQFVPVKRSNEAPSLFNITRTTKSLNT